MPQQYRTDTTVLAINNTDASGTDHLVCMPEAAPVLRHLLAA